ncbi:MAG: NAD(P)-binding domain-containing protein [Muribaculaceae bacterium]|nr:NAD(P)-binding domain-containing protein [Muribaculaceae bacterium]
MDRILIIGAGAMGSAIARGLARTGVATGIYNRSAQRLKALDDVEGLQRFSDLGKAVEEMMPDLVIVALPAEASRRTIESLSKISGPGKACAATLSPMISLADMQAMIPGRNVARIMPNIGITKGESMTFICAAGPSGEKAGEKIAALFRTMGDAVLIPEHEMGAVTALASCGTAYALRYIRACMQAGVQMGLEAPDACRYTLQTLRGACALLADGNSHPEAEIDKVCTPGGLTIRGVNALDRGGFSAATIGAILESFKS